MCVYDAKLRHAKVTIGSWRTTLYCWGAKVIYNDNNNDDTYCKGRKRVIYGFMNISPEREQRLGGREVLLLTISPDKNLAFP